MARIASYHPVSHYASSLEVEGVPLTSGPGFYKGNVVHVKKVDKKSVDLTRDIRKELIHVSTPRPVFSVSLFFVVILLSPPVCFFRSFACRLPDLLTPFLPLSCLLSM